MLDICSARAYNHNARRFAIIRMGDIMVLRSVGCVPEYQFQKSVEFPDWQGNVDNSLPTNCAIGFFGYEGQGSVFLKFGRVADIFTVYINGHRADLSSVRPDQSYELDIADVTRNGINMIQVSAKDLCEDPDTRVHVMIPYPVVIEREDNAVYGPDPRIVRLIRDIVESDISFGFPSAQWALVKDGRLVLSDCAGTVNAYHEDLTPKKDSPPVTKDTLYDLASVTKMMATNFAIQKLVSDGLLDIHQKIVQIIGNAFVDETIEIRYRSMEEYPGLDTVKAWKSELSVRDLMCHQGGFPPDPGYFQIPMDAAGLNYDPHKVNVLFSGYEGNAETREKTKLAICKTPLMYRPGTRTVYSDVDYMILGWIVEAVSGTDQDTYLKKTFYGPMGLTHLTFNPLQHGFEPSDCAATELQGNTRDGNVSFQGNRTHTLQGLVHDGKAYHCMAGISGHAGLFGNAEDLAKLGSVMISGGYGPYRYFTQTVMDLFNGPKSTDAGNWGIGWWRQGEDSRVTYFGTQSDSFVIGHQGWTGTLVMIDVHERMVLAYLTNKINSPVTDGKVSKDRFDGSWFTASSLGFASQLISIGYLKDADLDKLIPDLLCDMVMDSMKLIPKRPISEDHPSIRNVKSKIALYRKYAAERGDEEAVRKADTVFPLLLSGQIVK